MSALESIVRFFFLFCGLLVLPIGYMVLCWKMRKAHLQHAPYLHFFLVFGAWGGLSLCFATISATPVAAMIAFVALWLSPPAIFISSFFVFRRYRESRFHAAAFKSGVPILDLPYSLLSYVHASQDDDIFSSFPSCPRERGTKSGSCMISHEGTKARRHEEDEEAFRVPLHCQSLAGQFGNTFFPSSSRTGGHCTLGVGQKNHALSLSFLRAFVPSCLRVTNKKSHAKSQSRKGEDVAHLPFFAPLRLCVSKPSALSFPNGVWKREASCDARSILARQRPSSISNFTLPISNPL